MAAACPRRGRGRRVGAPSRAGPRGAAECGAACAASRLVATWRRSLRFSWRCLDGEPGGRRHRPGVWGTLLARSCQCALAPDRLESATAHRAGDAAQRRRSPAVGRGALARHQKGADEQQSAIVWVDESAFYLLPLAVRTWAPVGQTPVPRVPLTRDHLSVISGITLTGDLFLDLQEQAYDAEGVVRFLRALLEQVVGHVTVIWDGAPIHRSRVVQAVLRDGAAHRLHLEQLPGYAPDLNPDEGIWNDLKRVELGNVCCRGLAELTEQVRLAEQRLRDQPEIIRACSHQCGYSV